MSRRLHARLKFVVIDHGLILTVNSAYAWIHKQTYIHNTYIRVLDYCTPTYIQAWYIHVCKVREPVEHDLLHLSGISLSLSLSLSIYLSICLSVCIIRTYICTKTHTVCDKYLNNWQIFQYLSYIVREPVERDLAAFNHMRLLGNYG